MKRRTFLATAATAFAVPRFTAAQGAAQPDWDESARDLNLMLSGLHPVETLRALEAAEPAGVLAENDPALITVPWHAPVDNALSAATGFVLYADASGPTIAPDAAGTTAGAIIVCDSADIAYELLNTLFATELDGFEREHYLAGGAQAMRLTSDTLTLEAARVNNCLFATLNQGTTLEALISHALVTLA